MWVGGRQRTARRGPQSALAVGPRPPSCSSPAPRRPIRPPPPAPPLPRGAPTAPARPLCPPSARSPGICRRAAPCWPRWRQGWRPASGEGSIRERAMGLGPVCGAGGEVGRRPPAAGRAAPCSLLPAPCSLLPAPCSLLPSPCSLLPAPCSLRRRCAASPCVALFPLSLTRTPFWDTTVSRLVLRRPAPTTWQLPRLSPVPPRPASCLRRWSFRCACPPALPWRSRLVSRRWRPVVRGRARGNMVSLMIMLVLDGGRHAPSRQQPFTHLPLSITWLARERGERGRGVVTAESPIKARFVSPATGGDLTVLVQDATRIRPTFMQLSDIGQWGDAAAVAGLLLPRGTRVLASAVDTTQLPPRDTGTLVGVVQPPPQTLYRHGKGRFGGGIRDVGGAADATAQPPSFQRPWPHVRQVRI